MRKMIQAILIALVSISSTATLHAQSNTNSMMLRVTEDNDCFGDLRKGMSTDNAYTNGTGIDILYTKEHESKFFIDRWMPKAGDSSINTYGISGMHVMYTPSNSESIYYQSNDYAWAAALYFTHSLYSYNPQKKYSFKTDLTAGVMGPIALGKPMQRFVHRLIKDPGVPQGWDNQFNNDVLLNASFTAEKQIAHIDDCMELIVSGKVSAGTMTNAIDLGPILVFGKMNPYFNGVFSQYRTKGGKHPKRLSVYFKIKPGIRFVGRDALLQGGMFTRKNEVKVSGVSADVPGNTGADAYMLQPYQQITHVVTYQSCGIVVSYSRLSLAYTQTHTSELIKNTYSHTYGNISIAYTW